MSNVAFLAELEAIIAQRLKDPPEGSYTARLAAKGTVKVAQKVGEEAVELALAAVAQDREHVTAEAADLIYHAWLLLALRDVEVAEVVAELKKRHTGRSR